METLFYFNDINQLTDFDAFEVKPISDCHSRTIREGETPKFWSVVGTVKLEKSGNLESRQFPVADLPSELYAGLFANLCEQLTGKA